jgi:serine beta-lactamase-like protein LACTB, mitochondrial
MKSKYILISLLLLSVLCCKSQEQTSSDTKYDQAIELGRQLMDSLLQTGLAPGMDIAISIDGNVVWSEGFGYADLEHQQPVLAGKTRFRIGSVSKPLAAASVGKLMDMGKLDLEKPIETYVPYWPQKRYSFTVHQLAGHIAGIRHYDGDEFLSAKYFASVEAGIDMFKDDSLLFEPGERFSYSSHGFNLLSAAVEGASGESFLPFMQREVFDPIGMSSTCADRNDSIILNRASFYELSPNGAMVNARYVDNSYKWAGGGFISTTLDLLKFGEAHMKAGFLTEETLTTLITPQILNNGEKSRYGVGWFSGGEGEMYRISHGGGSIGGITDFVVYPELSLVITILSNSSDTRYGNVLERIVIAFEEAK